MLKELTGIRAVSFLEILLAPNAGTLIDEYAAECSIPAIGNISPQADIYRRIEEFGNMQCFGAFDGEEVAGFGNVLTTVMPHYGRKVATLESLFVQSKYRHTSIGSDLMRTIEEFALASGCVGILYSAPANGSLERLLEAKKAYQRTNTVFYRSL